MTVPTFILEYSPWKLDLVQPTLILFWYCFLLASASHHFCYIESFILSPKYPSGPTYNGTQVKLMHKNVNRCFVGTEKKTAVKWSDFSVQWLLIVKMQGIKINNVADYWRVLAETSKMNISAWIMWKDWTENTGNTDTDIKTESVSVKHAVLMINKWLGPSD